MSRKKSALAPSRRRCQGRPGAGAIELRKPAPSELDRLEREIASTDAEIDGVVYELYGITDEERKIVES